MFIIRQDSIRTGGSSAQTNVIDTLLPAYVYITSEELVLIRDKQVMARLSRTFVEADPNQNKVAWTHRGDYVMVLSGINLESDTQSELIFINTHTGAQGRLPCSGCDFTPIGDNDVLVSSYISGSGQEATFEYMKFNLDSPETGVSAELPSIDVDNLGGRFFLSSTRQYILTNQGVNQGGRYEQKLEIVKFDDHAPVLSGYAPSSAYIPVAAIEDSSDGDAKFAVAARVNPGGCVAPFPISLLSSTGEVTITDMSAAEPPGYVPNVQGGMRVNDLWWGLDGHLRATIASWTCDDARRFENEKMVLASPSRLWRLDEQKWVLEDAAPATIVRQLVGDVRMVLTMPDCIGEAASPEPVKYCNVGALYRDEHGDRTLIAERVLSVSVPPRQS